MKLFCISVALVVLAIAGFATWDNSRITCSYQYNTSFNGLYILKQQVCYGRAGMENSRKTVARKPLFTEF